MKQKNIWMLLLAIGIVSSLMSCNTIVDGRYIFNYCMINNTNVDLLVAILKPQKDSIYYKAYEYDIAKGDTLKQEGDFIFGMAPGTISLSDSVEITFGDTRKVNFGKETKSPFNIIQAVSDNYTLEIISEYYRTFTYTFTEDDYNNALPIEDGEE
ncbi:MAG: hypothetical protein ACK5IJ_01925 [Mangrovibacterium sp.]